MEQDDKMLNSSLLQLLNDPLLPLSGHSSSRPSPVDIDDEHIEPEPQQGNMEYKLKLIDPSPTRFQHLVTQMKWRLAEGNGEALYVIGVEDDGYLTGLPEEQLQQSLRTLENMAAAAGAATTLLRTRTSIRDEGKVAEVLVRRVPDNQQFLEVFVAAVGGGSVGKSTLLGVLVGGELDNGHGRARVNLFRHRHEIASGQTSSISHEMLGFDSSGEVVTGTRASGHDASTAEICECSSKVVSFFDFPGHERYIKTTLLGFSGRKIDYVALVVGSSTGLCPTTRSQLELVIALQLPFFVIITKIDTCTRAALTNTLKDLMQYLKGPGCKRVPVMVNNTDDVMVPIFLVSSVSGKNLDLLRKFLNLLTPNNHGEEEQCGQPAFLQVDAVYNIHEVGPIVAGTLQQGIVRVGDELMYGPDDNGRFVPVTVTSIQRNRVNYHLVKAGQHASLSLSGVSRGDIRRGQVLTADKAQCVACTEFDADLMLTSTSSAVSQRAAVTVFVGTSRQSAIVTPVADASLRPGFASRAHISLLSRPEHVLVGARMLLHDQRTHGFGTVTAITPLPVVSPLPAEDLADGGIVEGAVKSEQMAEVLA